MLSIIVVGGTARASEQKLLASDGLPYDQFGNAVAISGNFAIVGAPYYDDLTLANPGDSGAAYIYHYNGTSWVEQQKLLPADGTANKLFGWSVAISGNYAVVGAFGDGDPLAVPSKSYAGAAYIFFYNGTSWVQQQKLLASDRLLNDQFGYSVGISGDYAIVGADLGDKVGRTDSGSAYIFKRSGTSWTQLVEVVASDGALDDGFGIDVAISGDYAIVGAYHDDYIHPDPINNPTGENFPDIGSAYIYKFNGASWTQLAKLIPPDGKPGDLFGGAVRISGSNAIIGAVNNWTAGSFVGSAYIFNYNGTSWVLQQKLVPSATATYDSFGYSVAIEGDKAVVGSLGNGNYSAKGAASVYSLAAGSWGLQQVLAASDGSLGDLFGDAAGVSGNFALVGAALGGDNGDHSGAAYLFRGVASQQPLTVSKNGTGTGTVNSTVPDAALSCGTNCSGTYARGTSVTLTAIADPGNTFSGWSGCDTSAGDSCTVAMYDERSVVATFAVPSVVTDKIGAYRQGEWYLDASGDGAWEPGVDFSGSFGTAAMTPLVGDWTGNGHTRIGAYVAGTWYFDLNGNGVWDGEPVDRMVNTWGGEPDDIPVVGDWNGDGVKEIGIYRSSIYTWYLDYDGDTIYNPAVDISQAFGFAGCIPVVGDWSGNGRDKIGVYSDGQWYLDANGTFAWDGSPADTFVASFGVAGMLPVAGDWNGSGVDRVGAYRDGNWYLDLDGNGSWDPASDKQMGPFGVSGMLPVVGKW
jgi:hypothetical protein